MNVENSLMLPEQEEKFRNAVKDTMKLLGEISGEIANSIEESNKENFNVNMYPLLLDRIVLSFILNLGIYTHKINEGFINDIEKSQKEKR